MKHKIRFSLFISLLHIVFLNASNTIDVANLSVKLSFQQTSDYYYAFNKGDIIVFNLEMIKGKHIKSVEITALPSNTLLSEFKTKNISSQRITIKKKCVVRFRFYNSSLGKRVCRAKIQRIPLNEASRNFNTDWKWKILRDTVYVNYTEDSLIGYNTVKFKETVKELKEEKLEEILVFDKLQKVHSCFNGNNKAYLKVTLPRLNNTKYREEKIISWAYWIGVGEESYQAYRENLKSIENLAKGVTAYYSSPLGALAIGEITNLVLPRTGEDVQYYLVSDYENIQKFYDDMEFLQFDMGKGRAAFGRNDRLTQGHFYIAMSNDNKIVPINVNVKVIAIKYVKVFEDIIYNRERKEPQYTTLYKTRMVVNQTRIRIPVE